MKKVFVLSAFGAIMALLVLFLSDKPLASGIGLCLLLACLAGMYVRKKVTRRQTVISMVSYLTVFIAIVFYIMPAAALSQGQGTVLSENWWQALNWIKNNTDECATVATYWDPGHFITGIAERAVVFDGASQNSVLIKSYNGTESGLKITPYDNGIKEVSVYEGVNETRARIKDVTTVMLTANESLAVSILRDYVKPGCNEIYFIASSDLIFKSQWWSYFATWDPTREGDKPLSKGDIYTYAITQLARRKPLTQFGVVGYEYPVSQTQSIILCQQNNTIAPCTKDAIGLFQSGEQFIRLQKIVWPTSGGFLSRVFVCAIIQKVCF
jgi:asparagine N-glycosylation enzyme membrane subunit Stt3